MPDKKTLISGTAPKISAPFVHNISDFFLNEEFEQEGEHQRSPTTSSQHISTNQSPGPVVTETLAATPTLQSVDQKSDSPLPEPSILSYDIAKLLDEIAANVRDINIKVDQYNDLMEKTYEYLKLRYQNTLTDDM